jgi:hypothetical protein
LRRPDHGSRASVDFSNILTKSVIERLAEVDEYEVVREVQVQRAAMPTRSN